MTTVNPTPASLPAALAEPTVPVRRSWIALIFAANLGVWMAFFTPIQVLLPQQIERIAPGDKEAMLAVVTGLGALAAVLANPLAGALSDRTSLRLANRHFGRRHVWTAAGAVLGALALVLLARQDTIAGVAVGWVAAQVCFNAMLASLTAAIPDRVPVAQRGGVSGWVGIPQALGLVVGAVLVTAAVTGNAAGYAAIALAVLLLSLPFALLTEDDPLPREHRSALRLRALLASMWISPRRHPDFAWAWFTRFLVQTGNALGTLYLLYFLSDGVRVADPEGALLVLILLYTLGMMLTAVVAGRLSDRSGRRKVFVIVSGLIMAVAAVLLAMAPTWPMAIVAALLLGAGYGVYLAVDAALITQVLPAATDRAKDLGVINIANSAPQVLGPALSAPIVVHLGGYPTLYAVTAAVTLVGSVLVLKIKAVP
ncbi:MULTISPECIES: MFS transporter [Micromonospora]|uniref:MFS transporter n=1 Tax=Micromonospora solifontis TaxID=2487138 RepID=A0ABX9WHA4_9ACTN|nr:MULTISPECIES: MFS transporter [Micromonospora]NES13934.1 MFS transporter [Micromonospora sp. PPF5-17B]NES37507.1 MFS transporter [Micromonospora solifontis]NES54034.1 MFS transporter [Micromonospora sp. PPF5-6]RNL98313.1 MFS transporter [Micromonospora solifontis]